MAYLYVAADCTATGRKSVYHELEFSDHPGLSWHSLDSPHDASVPRERLAGRRHHDV
jgi:hypothetical protein